jgi:hypothetical protein
MTWKVPSPETDKKGSGDNRLPLKRSGFGPPDPQGQCFNPTLQDYFFKQLQVLNRIKTVPGGRYLLITSI